MPKITGQCLCGAVTFESDGDIAFQGNCHCKDCRQVTGAAFATLLFLAKDAVTISGETATFSHGVDSGNTLIKHFCPKCGSAMFGENAARPESLAIRGGQIDQQELVQPEFNVYASSKLACTVLDPNIPAFDKMPG